MLLHHVQIMVGRTVVVPGDQPSYQPIKEAINRPTKHGNLHVSCHPKGIGMPMTSKIRLPRFENDKRALARWLTFRLVSDAGINTDRMR